MNDNTELDPLYVAARRVLLDALAALAPHGKAFIVVGAQAVYLRTQPNEVVVTVAPYTTDADLALDPTLLGDEPLLEDSMRRAGFELRGDNDDQTQPGIWSAIENVEVAGVAALLVAKAHKIHDRVATGRVDRLSDKDAADVYRIMQTASPPEVVATLRALLVDPLAGGVTEQALDYLRDLFGRRTGEGVAMAQRALRLATDEAQIATLSVSFTQRLRDARS